MHRFHLKSMGIAVGLVLAAAPPAAAQQAVPGTPFWEVLNDSTLDRLLTQAVRGNLDLRAADARLDGAGAARTHAALGLAPVVTASAGYTRQRMANAAFPGAGPGALPDRDLWSSALHASWEVDVAGRLRGRLRAENAFLSSAGEDLRSTRVAVAAAVAGTYFDLRGAQSRLAVAQRNAENQRRTLELTVTRLEAGRGNAFDTERARAQLATTLAAIPSLEAQVTALEQELAVLLGRPPQEIAAELVPGDGIPALPDSLPALAADQVIAARPDVAAAEDRVAASRALASSARSDYLPRLSIAASAGYVANEVDAFGRTGTFNYTVGPVLSWPLLDIGRVKARVDAAQAQELEARAQHEQLVLRAQAELESATVGYRTARTRLEHLREAAQASERAAELARLRYEGGIADFLQVLDAERTLLAAQDQLAQAEAQAAAAYVALYRARGGVWSSR